MSVVRVDSSYTSVTCSRCGVAQFDASIEKRNRKGSSALIAAIISTEVSMQHETYWRGGWPSRPPLRESRISQGAPVCQHPTSEISGVRPEKRVSIIGGNTDFM